ncbi:hypothetical protein GWN42_24130 [candidate division KSB1 bacterium]|nr:hypothetical protein [candidate division KSB1 bacterium]
MNERKLSLGSALAFIKKEDDGTASENRISPAHETYLQPLRERHKFLTDSPQEVERIWKSIHKKGCHREKTFLAENGDFFIVFLLLGIHAEQEENHCKRLSEHLNNCYRCFEEYADVMLDFIKGYYPELMGK